MIFETTTSSRHPLDVNVIGFNEVLKVVVMREREKREKCKGWIAERECFGGWLEGALPGGGVSKQMR